MVEDMKEQENITELRRYLNEKKKFSINDFTVKQTIGHGTFGTVDLASIEFRKHALAFSDASLNPT